MNLESPSSPPWLSGVIQAGTGWSMVLPRHTSLRLTDVQGGGNGAALFYRAACPTERYNMPDTLKAQHTARLQTGHVLYSDLGRILCSIVEDSTGWHDPIGGHSHAALVKQKYGPGEWQELRHGWHRNSRDLFLNELAKHNLGLPDLVPNVNFFSSVKVELDGSLRWNPRPSRAGDTVVLRMEMEVLVVLNACQHPLDPNPEYAPRDIAWDVRRVPPPGPQDICRISCPENARGFENNEMLYAPFLA